MRPHQSDSFDAGQRTQIVDLQQRSKAPPAPIRLLDRERLRPLRSEHPPLLTTYIAPSGFGKSVAMAAYRHQLDESGVPSIWLDIEKAGSAVDWLAQQLRRALTATGESGSGTPIGADHIATSLFDVIDQRRAPIAIFIDRFELAATPSNETLLRDLLGRLSPGSALVVSSRQRPQLDQLRLKLRGELHEFDQEAMTFTTDEVAQLLSDALGTCLADCALADAERLTGNWPAAVRLLLLRLDQVGSMNPAAVAAALADDLNDFFLSEVYGVLPADTCELLTAVACADTLTAELCEALTGCAETGSELESLAKTGCFVSPLATRSSRTRYRVYPLFNRFLRELAATTDPARYQARCLQAATWLESRDRIGEAADCASRAGAYERAATLLARIAMDQVKDGDFQAVIDAVERLPVEVTAGNTLLFAAYLWALALTDRPDTAAAHLETLEAAANGISTPELAASLYCLRIILAARRGDLEFVRSRADEVLSRMATADGFHFGAVTMAIAQSYLSIGGKQRAQEIIARAQQVCTESKRRNARASFQLIEAFAEFADGRLIVATASLRQMYEQLMATPDYPAIPAAMIATALARVLYEQNELAASAKLLRCHLAMVIDNGLPGAVISGYVTAARIEFIQGNMIEALRLTNEARSYGRRRNLSRVLEIMEWEAARYAYLRGDLESALRIRQNIPEKSRTVWHPLFADLHLLDLWPVRLALWQRHSESALELIAAQRADPAKQLGQRAVFLDFFTAIGLEQAGEHKAAKRYLTTALAAGLAGGMVRPFLDEGSVAIRLLRTILVDFRDNLGPTQFRLLERPLQTLQDSLDVEYPTALPTRRDRSSQAIPASVQMARLSPLTTQELEILRHLKGGLSNRELGSMLDISTETVKWHLRNIFSKLQVKNRTEAVFVAEQIEAF